MQIKNVVILREKGVEAVHEIRSRLTLESKYKRLTEKQIISWFEQSPVEIREFLYGTAKNPFAEVDLINYPQGNFYYSYFSQSGDLRTIFRLKQPRTGEIAWHAALTEDALFAFVANTEYPREEMLALSRQFAATFSLSGLMGADRMLREAAVFEALHNMRRHPRAFRSSDMQDAAIELFMSVRSNPYTQLISELPRVF